jgi:hypothetical protein
VITLPTSAETSDLPLRPAFLTLLERFADAARARNGAHRTTVGEAWAFEGAKTLEVTGPDKKLLRVTDEATTKLVVPDRIGTYEITLDGDKLIRLAAPAEREVDLRPRAVNPQTRAAALGDVRAKRDISPHIAMALLLLLVAELALRAWARASRSNRAAPDPVGSGPPADAVETKSALWYREKTHARHVDPRP